MGNVKKATKGYENRFYYLVSGLFCTGVGLYINIPELFLGRFPESMMILALGVSQLMFAY
ncbi:MAG: hypothetical protein ACE3L7_10075 [Candidatus Pristimantibacillus sp.]